MPLYEFYCSDCHTVFTFFSRKVDPSRCPACPRCGKARLERQVSAFAVTGRAKEPAGDADDLPIDESKMERAMEALAGEAERLNEDDPRQAAQLMRKFSRMTGMEFGKGMEEALGRLEAGEDPEKIEEEMGDAMEEEEPFVLPGERGRRRAARRAARGAPRRDPTLYEL
mgnify:CR=1 FL=1